MNELKPCPFCGGRQTYRKRDGGVWLTTTNHKRVCIMRELLPFIAFDTEAEAIAAWNTRVERTCKMYRYKNALGFIDEWQCSECGADVGGIAGDTPPNYCPNCGARVVVE